MIIKGGSVITRRRQGFSSPSGTSVLRGTTAFAGAPDTPVARTVTLFLERGPRSFATHFCALEYAGRTESATDGSWVFTGLNPAMRFTVIAIDSSGVYDPVVKSGLVPTAED